jgi:hypothetical protein
MVPVGLRLSPPDGCPDVIQKLMISCWKPEPHDRATFEMICHELNNSGGNGNQVFEGGVEVGGSPV